MALTVPKLYIYLRAAGVAQHVMAWVMKSDNRSRMGPQDTPPQERRPLFYGQTFLLETSDMGQLLDEGGDRHALCWPRGITGFEEPGCGQGISSFSRGPHALANFMGVHKEYVIYPLFFDWVTMSARARSVVLESLCLFGKLAFVVAANAFAKRRNAARACRILGICTIVLLWVRASSFEGTTSRP